MSPFAIALIILVVMALGATVQSVAGMGFGMIAVPALVLTLGPAEGVLWGNLAGLLLAAALTITKWREINWLKAGGMCLAAVPFSIGSVLMLKSASEAALDVVIGALMVAMVIFSVFALKLPRANGWWPLLSAGALGAFLSATVAQSGPAMAAYAQASRWEQKEFAASVQPYFLWLNILVVPLKLEVGIGAHILAQPWLILVATLAVLAGVVIARPVAKRVPPQMARNLALAVAGFGAASILWRGLVSLYG